jgi:hypothetical protein
LDVERHVVIAFKTVLSLLRQSRTTTTKANMTRDQPNPYKSTTTTAARPATDGGTSPQTRFSLIDPKDPLGEGDDVVGCPTACPATSTCLDDFFSARRFSPRQINLLIFFGQAMLLLISLLTLCFVVASSSSLTPPAPFDPTSDVPDGDQTTSVADMTRRELARTVRKAVMASLVGRNGNDTSTARQFSQLVLAFLTERGTKPSTQANVSDLSTTPPSGGQDYEGGDGR